MVLNISRIITDYHSNYGMASQFKKHAAQVVVFYNTLQNTSPHTWLSKSIRCKKMACIKITPYKSCHRGLVLDFN